MADKFCVYCGLTKDAQEFSLEHIWPDALGGDFLEDFWKSDDICQKCNSMSGVFVDGAFIKSWMGASERAHGAREYLSLNSPSKGAFPLHYMGPLPDFETRPGEVVEFWMGPCGEQILHFRSEDKEALWASYAGGDPRKGSKKARWGRAYILLRSSDEFWNLVALSSFKHHFKGARYIANADFPEEWTAFEKPDPSDPVQGDDLKVLQAFIDKTHKREDIRAAVNVPYDLGNRFLAKVALAAGYQMLGKKFLETDYAKQLRFAFREADAVKRRNSKVRGAGYLQPSPMDAMSEVFAWPGAWVLLIIPVSGTLSLNVVTPAGKLMTILISDDTGLIAGIEKEAQDGLVWLTIPALGEAVGPMPLPDYLAHQLKNISVPALAALEAKRIDPASLPPRRIADGEG
ncbi:hypothetical protein ABIA24_006764 [Sinorhizobium fredii]|uniref:HNH endonuclease n=1 Tax=Rhizobium fredii TaxID=380 RepID=UPI0035187ED0